MSDTDTTIELNESELVLVSMAMLAQGKSLDASKTNYTEIELRELGFIRENWSHEEIVEKGLGSDGVVTSFDDASKRALTKLPVDVPFADGVQKWQLPLSAPGFRVVMTRFPPGTTVTLHAHPNIPGLSKCGQLRVVVSGSITYADRKFGPGDWFFIPNGVQYSFTTDPDVETLEAYWYEYKGLAEQRMRFSNFNLGSLESPVPAIVDS